MGRTMPTSRDVLDRLEFEWRDYRRALTREEQALFDAMWQKARRHASAMSNQTPLDPMQAVFVSVLLEQAREIATLRALPKGGGEGGGGMRRPASACDAELRIPPAPPPAPLQDGA